MKKQTLQEHMVSLGLVTIPAVGSLKENIPHEAEEIKALIPQYTKSLRKIYNTTVDDEVDHKALILSLDLFKKFVETQLKKNYK